MHKNSPMRPILRAALGFDSNGRQARTGAIQTLKKDLKPRNHRIQCQNTV